jgi:hypothetical protein
MKQSISILIGAGFSANMGYPVGSQLNNLLTKCTGDEFAFHTDGTLMISSDGKKPYIGYKTSYDMQFDFCKELIKFYNETNNGFDYEEFYDFLKEDAASNEKVKAIAKPYLKGYSSVGDLLFHLDNIYAQLIDYFLKDKNGDRWHDNSGHACGPIYPGYTGILNCLQNLSASNDVNIHTLNHDLFLESLDSSDWIMGELSDGFEELGSTYYGELSFNGRQYKVRLSRYTGLYDKKFRLYKLHGSRDYGVYYTFDKGIGIPENYVKTRFGVRFGDIFKERTDEHGNLTYEHCFINYHADFLTGTTSKIERYKEPLLYKKLFELFRNNLKNDAKLIIVGYSGKDTEINKMIFQNFDHKNKPVIIIDPFSSVPLKALERKLNARLVNKQLDDISMDDISK